MRIPRKQFENLVSKAIDGLPKPVVERIQNVEIVVEYAPTDEDFEVAGENPDEVGDLFGLYEGIPLTERTHDYGLVPPDVITIFQRAHEDECDTMDCLREEVLRTIKHEIAHYFGIGDDRLDELGAY